MKDSLYEAFYFVWMVFWFWVILSAFSGCTTAPIVRIQYVPTPVYIPIPATLTAPVEVNLLPGVTYGDALGSLREGLSRCEADKAAIRVLTPPSPPNR